MLFAGKPPPPGGVPYLAGFLTKNLFGRKRTPLEELALGREPPSKGALH